MNPSPSSFPAAKRPVLTIVAGRPGAGKSTLARKLAGRIHCPLLSRDAMKEGLVNTAETKDDPGGALAREAGEALFAAIELLLERRVTLVVEAFFPEEFWRSRMETLKRLARVRLVFCVVNAETAQRRMEQRRTNDRHWDEFHHAPVDQQAQAAGRYDPPVLGVPTLLVDCRGEYVPGIEEIHQFIKS